MNTSYKTTAFIISIATGRWKLKGGGRTCVTTLSSTATANTQSPSSRSMRARVADGARSVSSLTYAVCSVWPAGPFAHCSIFAPTDIYKDPECDVTGWLQRKHSPSEMFYIPPPCFPLPDTRTHTHISTHESFPSFFPSPSSLSSPGFMQLHTSWVEKNTLRWLFTSQTAAGDFVPMVLIEVDDMLSCCCFYRLLLHCMISYRKLLIFGKKDRYGADIHHPITILPTTKPKTLLNA